MLESRQGLYFPPCHILDICGFQVLFDCPVDLSSLAICSPVPTGSNSIAYNENFSCSCGKYAGLESNEDKRRKIDKPLDANSLICAEPRYRTVKDLLLWNVSFIDVVLISSPMGMLGLPFLTRNKDFSAKVYATEATARIGQLMMEDLIVSGPDGIEFGGWMHGTADVKACILKVESLKYAEEACYGGTLIIKAFSSSLEIGSYFSSCNGPGNDDNCSGPVGNHYSNLSSDDVNSEGHDTLLNDDDEYLEDMEKLTFICSCSVDCIKASGSALIPIARYWDHSTAVGEQFALDLAFENMRVPFLPFLLLQKSLSHLQISFQNGCASSGKIVYVEFKMSKHFGLNDLTYKQR
ncbi:hypothetical protein Salat_0197400 [Sesamum alatum]|uniref:Uncharacterized protein n=1 Tax=Sesamum alatum TaxID=300844 RepID=A0AAE1YY61_9LAMI|nr:hypothetical protein Salat_0197400 [Sesamum alatum]